MAPLWHSACGKEELTSYLAGGVAALQIGLLLGAYHGARWCSSKGELEVVTPDQGGRLQVLDNAKFLGMCCVVLHAELCPGDYPVAWLENGAAVSRFLHPFGARLFCFISGVVSCEPLPTRRASFLIRLGSPLVCACCLIQPLDRMLFGPGSWIPATTNEAFWDVCRAWRTIVVPGDEPFWYLEALITWRVMAHLLLPYRVGVRLFLGCALAVLGGNAIPRDAPFALAQSSVMFPLYMFGQLFPMRSVLSLFPWAPGSAALGGVVLWQVYSLESSAFGALFLTNVPDFTWQGVGYCSVADVLSYWLLGLFRLVWDLSKALLLLLVICPRGRGHVSKLGGNTLYPLLLHKPLVRFTVKFLCATGLMPQITKDSASDMSRLQHAFVFGALWLLVVAYAVCLTVLTSAPRVREIGQVFVEPDWLDSFLRKEEVPEPDRDVEEESSLLRSEGMFDGVPPAPGNCL